MTTRSDFPYFHEFRIRYSEVDAQNIVFNAHYLTFFDQAITEYFRGRDWSYKALVKDQGLDFHTVRAVVDYKRPIAGDSLIEVGVRPGRIGNSSLTWALAIFLKGEDDLLSTGEVVWVASRRGEHKSCPLPPELVARLKAA